MYLPFSSDRNGALTQGSLVTSILEKCFSYFNVCVFMSEFIHTVLFVHFRPV